MGDGLLGVPHVDELSQSPMNRDDHDDFVTQDANGPCDATNLRLGSVVSQHAMECICLPSNMRPPLGHHQIPYLLVGLCLHFGKYSAFSAASSAPSEFALYLRAIKHSAPLYD